MWENVSMYYHYLLLQPCIHHRTQMANELSSLFSLLKIIEALVSHDSFACWFLRFVCERVLLSHSALFSFFVWMLFFYFLFWFCLSAFSFDHFPYVGISAMSNFFSPLFTPFSHFNWWFFPLFLCLQIKMMLNLIYTTFGSKTIFWFICLKGIVSHFISMVLLRKAVFVEPRTTSSFPSYFVFIISNYPFLLWYGILACGVIFHTNVHLLRFWSLLFLYFLLVHGSLWSH